MATDSSGDAVKRTRWRYTRLGTIFLTRDFTLGVVLGSAVGWVLSSSESVGPELQGILLALAAIGAGIATLTLTALTLLMAVLTKDYKALVARVRGGLPGIVRPFRIVAILASTSTVLALAGLAIVPLAGDRTVLTWLAIGPAMIFLLWAVLGVFDLVTQVEGHIEYISELEAQ